MRGDRVTAGLRLRLVGLCLPLYCVVVLVPMLMLMQLPNLQLPGEILLAGILLSTREA